MHGEISEWQRETNTEKKGQEEDQKEDDEENKEDDGDGAKQMEDKQAEYVMKEEADNVEER